MVGFFSKVIEFGFTPQAGQLAAEGPADELTVVDVLVIGSGAGGLATAISAARSGLTVVVVEKSRWFGGTSAYSGGGVWVPLGAVASDAGDSDSLNEVDRYLKAVMGPDYDDPKVRAFLNNAPEALSFFRRVSDLQLVPSGMVDYESELPGASFSRTLLSPEYDGRKIGPLLKLLRPALPQMGGPLGMQIGIDDIAPLMNAHRSFRAFTRTLGLVGRHLFDLLRFGKASRLTNGNALTARLLKGASDAGVKLLNETEALSLTSSDGRITGAMLRHSGHVWQLDAARGVVLATGGFAADVKHRQLHVPLADDVLVLQAEGNIGDGLRMAQDAGGQLASANVANGIWAPMSMIPGVGPFPHIVRDRFLPGALVVDKEGRRFVDESAHYQRFCQVMQQMGINHAFLVCDKRFLQKYGLGIARPAPWSNAALVRSGYLIEADTVTSLARKLDIDSQVLSTTFETFNAAARGGEDLQFKRGQTGYARAQGDSGWPNPNLGPVDEPPFYALRLFPGMLSSTLGLKTDERARVTDDKGEPIDGLFAVGVDMNSPWRGHYPAGGASLGPALTFGYIAGRALAGNAPVATL